MPRKLRVQYPGAIYHLMNRGDRREDIFEDAKDRLRFLGTLGHTCDKAGWQVHAYCLMSNRFHLVVETPEPNLVAGMKCDACDPVRARSGSPSAAGRGCWKANIGKGQSLIALFDHDFFAKGVAASPQFRPLRPWGSPLGALRRAAPGAWLG